MLAVLAIKSPLLACLTGMSQPSSIAKTVSMTDTAVKMPIVMSLSALLQAKQDQQKVAMGAHGDGMQTAAASRHVQQKEIRRKLPAKCNHDRSLCRSAEGSAAVTAGLQP